MRVWDSSEDTPSEVHKEHRHGCLASVFSSVLMRFFGLWISANITARSKLTPGVSFALFLISSFIFSLVLVDSHCVAQGQGDQAGGGILPDDSCAGAGGGGGVLRIRRQNALGAKGGASQKKKK